MKLFKNPFFYTSFLSILALGLIISSYVFGWTAPTEIPPGGNVVLETGATPAGSTGYIQFNNAGALGADSNLFWDNTNKRLGIGTTTPSYPLDVNGNMAIGNGSTAGVLTFRDIANASWQLSTSGYLLNFLNNNGGSYASKMVIENDGSVGIGITVPGQKLSVAGTIESTTGGFKFPNGSIQTIAAAVTTQACALCVTCGGTWPNKMGYENDLTTGHFQGYGTACAGSFAEQNNQHYHTLCCK